MNFEQNEDDTIFQELHENVPIQRDQQSRRALQQVSTIATRKDVVAWMMEDEVVNGEKGLMARTVDAFPDVFRSIVRNTNLVKAKRWWNSQDQLFPNEEDVAHTQLTFSRAQEGSWKRFNTKSAQGRGPIRAQWVTWLYSELLSEFERLHSAGVKFSAKLLRHVALEILVISNTNYNGAYRDRRDGRLIVNKITCSWMQHFMAAHNIVLLSQKGRLICSAEKEQYIRKLTAYHMGVLQRGFLSDEFDENLIENIDETHFVINCDNGRTLGFRGDDVVKYADVVSGGQSMTLVVRISGGHRGTIEDPMLIFSNPRRSYPINGLADNIPRVCYRSSAKGWMDQGMFCEYFEEPRAYQSDVHGRIKVVWCDNCNGHNLTNQLGNVLARKRTVLKFLPPCTTHLCQPADTFVISKIKDAWTRRWEEKKSALIAQGAWQNVPQGGAEWSGKLTNLGKRFFLQLAAESIQDVNRERDAYGITYARKAMIRCGMSLDLDGTWNVGQLFPHLRRIIEEYPQHFGGEDVPDIA